MYLYSVFAAQYTPLVSGGCHFCSFSPVLALPQEGRAPTEVHGEGGRVKSGSQASWSPSRQLHHHLLIQVPGPVSASSPHSAPRSRPSVPRPPGASAFTTCAELPAHPAARARAGTDTPARPLPTHAATPSLTPGARPREPGLAHVIRGPRPTTHPHQAPTLAHDRPHTSEAASRRPPRPRTPARPRIKRQQCRSPDGRPWAHPDPPWASVSHL